jgi:hypothetical protein
MQKSCARPASSAETSGPARRTELPDDDYNDHAAVATRMRLHTCVRAVAIVTPSKETQTVSHTYTSFHRKACELEISQHKPSESYDSAIEPCVMRPT